MIFKNPDGEVFGSLRGSEKGNTDITVVLGLGEAMEQHSEKFSSKR